ncbi:hypothetical protein FRC12_014695 [Ceratobasidium sp. 428]|nr:hypothetical protein FRC12_014695 [Ceratobasidium sp. 428]
MHKYSCPEPSCAFRSASEQAHKAHRARSEKCEVAFALETEHHKELYARSLFTNREYLDLVQEAAFTRPTAATSTTQQAPQTHEPTSTNEAGPSRVAGPSTEGVNEINADDMEWESAGPSGSHIPENPDNPTTPNATGTGENIWYQSSTGEIYRTVPGAGQRLRKCTTAFEALYDEQAGTSKAPWDPFASLDEWELAKWFVLHGISKSAIDEFLKLRIICRNVKISFSSRKTLYNRVDKLEGGPEWKSEIITLTGNRFTRFGHRKKEKLEMHFRDPVEIMNDLLARPDFRDLLVFENRETYLDATLEERVYNEMWTGNWWAMLQERLPYGGTLVPIILSSDKTCLTNFSGNKKAWPVYLTLGNIPKATRRSVDSGAAVLLGYIPVTKFKCFTPGEARQKAAHWLFHTCLTKMLAPLKTAGLDGVEVECADGWVRRCFPVLAAYVADHPEQCLIACCKQNTCWACKVPPDNRGDNATWEPKTQREVGIEIMAEAYGIRSVSFEENGYKPVGCAPFWHALPRSNIFSSLTPDLLHQAHKGLFKDHIFAWCRELVNNDDILDDRFSVLPAHSGVMSFKQGVTSLSQSTGRQHKAMEKSLSAVIAGLVPNRVLHAVQVAMEFIWVASLTTHTTSTLAWLRETLDEFHSVKDIFIEKKVRQDFNIPKLHSLQHYLESILLLGSLDGYNTELFERLHIDLAKDGYRASNKRDFMNQMIDWRYRIDAMLARDRFIRWTLAQGLTAPVSPPKIPKSVDKPTFTFSGATFTLAKRPSNPSATISTLKTRFGAENFDLAIARFFETEYPAAASHLTGLERYRLYVKADLTIDPRIDPYARGLQDCIHASPPLLVEDELEPGQFDTVLIRKNRNHSLEFGMSNHLVARVRVIFQLPVQFGSDEPFAYVQWFTAPTQSPVQPMNLYRIRHKFERDGQRSASIIRLSDIRRSCRLLPDFTDRTVQCTNEMLESCNAFFIDRALDEHTFRILY